MTDTQTSPDRASEPEMQTEPPSDLQALISRARALSPHLSDDDEAVSPIRGGVEAARELVLKLNRVSFQWCTLVTVSRIKLLIVHRLID